MLGIGILSIQSNFFLNSSTHADVIILIWLLPSWSPKPATYNQIDCTWKTYRASTIVEIDYNHTLFIHMNEQFHYSLTLYT